MVGLSTNGAAVPTPRLNTLNISVPVAARQRARIRHILKTGRGERKVLHVQVRPEQLDARVRRPEGAVKQTPKRGGTGMIRDLGSRNERTRLTPPVRPTEGQTLVAQARTQRTVSAPEAIVVLFISPERCGGDWRLRVTGWPGVWVERI